MTTLRFAVAGSVFAAAVVFLTVKTAAGQDNHYACYQIKAKTDKVDGVSLVDQITTQAANKCKLKLLCVPVDENGSGTPDPTKDYLCWQCKGAKPVAAYTVTDQFVSGLATTTKKLSLVCNPAAAAVRKKCYKNTYTCIDSSETQMDDCRSCLNNPSNHSWGEVTGTCVMQVGGCPP